MLHHLLLIIHLISATLWEGGHLILALGFLPKSLKERNTDVIRNFEYTYEKIGIPALLILVITGILLAYQYGIDLQKWF